MNRTKSGLWPRTELENGANERIATFTQDGLTGLGAADLTHFKNADYRLYVDGKTGANSADARAIYANGSIHQEHAVSAPYGYALQTVVKGAAQTDVDMTKAFAVGADVNGAASPDKFVVWGSGRTSVNFETSGFGQRVIEANVTGADAHNARALSVSSGAAENFSVLGTGAVTANDQMTINKEALGGYGFGILANITGTSTANRNRTKAFAVLNDGTEKLSIWGNGRIVSEDIIVGRVLVASLTPQNEVPDYVFADDYDLRPLSEVEAYVNEHSHLPGVPNAAEVKANGLDLAQMNLILLEKVEELTLYSIELEKRVKALEGDESEK